ncbi:polyprenyl synthetase family protein [Solicola sp. PLA-1-18]|uniref:polyprenyl synthetase family protein n=1 Tax=Solicola sp. PLA-1-18 TaxID=3380532 RepID=UPI003B8250B5
MEQPARPSLVSGIDAALTDFLARRRLDLAGLGPRIHPLLDAAGRAADGGKRLRALFCHAGWVAAGGDPDDAALLRASTAFEWLQASALVHDDLMDGSDTRRGRPSAHRAFEADHRGAAWAGDAERFGAGGAILLGDLLLSWADEAFRGAGLPLEATARATPYLDSCRSEVVCGQFLDLAQQARGTHDVDEAMRVVHYKAATYTVERPLQVGAALAGGSDELLGALSDFGLPLGEAFQLRDDLLGVFGDPAVTGKPAGDDLREGKHTVLVARAHAAADADQRGVVDRLLGDPDLDADGVTRLRDVIEATGARQAVEDDITRLESAADAALALVPVASPAGRDLLADLAARATRRVA